MNILTTSPQKDYELLDSGEGEKLERFGDVILARPDPEVLWQKKNPSMWSTAHAYFTHGERGAKWHLKKTLPPKWVCQLGDISLLLKLGNNKHVGVFPEQVAQWEWMVELVKSRQSRGNSKQDIKVLNLFGYTGGATCALAHVGAEVTHVDASKAAITWAHENKKTSGLDNATIRFMLDDARKFVERDIKRGVTYDAILMDPPVYGKGVKKEKWHIDENFLPLLERSVKLLSKNPLFVVVTGYASEYSHLSYANALSGVLPGVTIESGELTIQESSTERLLPAGIFARATFS